MGSWSDARLGGRTPLGPAAWRPATSQSHPSIRCLDTTYAASIALGATSGDYARFVAFVMKGGGLSPPLAKAMLSEQVRIDDHKSFGLGWQRLTGLSGGGFAIQHSGSDAGVRSLALAWPERREAIVILSNSDNAMPTWGLIIHEVFGEIGDETVALAR